MSLFTGKETPIMRKYKIETHLHTTYVSRCGWLGAQALARTYKELGYDALCITDHYNRTTFDYIEMDLSKHKIDVNEFLLGYRRVKKEAEALGIRVYEGAELRFDGSENDYLLYGFHHELLEDPETIISEGLEKFVPKYRADGAILIQAHPYRAKCNPQPAELLDGIEIYNASPRHNSHNELAQAYAEKYGLIKTAGSDAHRPGDPGLSGITTDILPEDGFGFAELLRSGDYDLIIPEEEDD